MEAGVGPKELISGPGSLGEYLDLKLSFFKSEIAKYQEVNQKTSLLKTEIGSIIQSKQKECDVTNQAVEELAKGNKEPGLDILRKEIDELEERIQFNKENENEKAARANNEILVVLQMLLADETGEQPDYFGYSVSRRGEAYHMPENVGRSDLLNAVLYKAMMALGSYNPPSSGYYQSPDSISPEYTMNRLFDYDCGLSDEEKAIITKQLSIINSSIKAFATEKFKYRYERSLPEFPGTDMKPQELIRYHSYNLLSESPSATFYMEGGQIKCRFSRDKGLAVRVFDLAQSAEGLELEPVKNINELPPELQGKIFDILRTNELKAHWENIAPRTKIPEILVL